ncbi:MAG TPA: type II secretion system protein GspG [Candidatus Nanoarchaeia archaeon]
MNLPRARKKLLGLPVGKAGFTLVELLVVLAVISVLISIGLASLRRAQASARDGQRRSDIQNIRGALEQYYADENVYPDTATWETDLENNPAATNPYLKEVPEDPSGTYVYSGGGQIYCIGADLETNSGTHPGTCSGAHNYVFTQSD